MKKWRVFILLAGAAHFQSPGVFAADAVFFDRHFSFPDDYTLEVVAGPPMVTHPIEADFDDRGRLFVTESSGSNDPAAVQLENRPHRVLRLDDADGDGVFDRRTEFAVDLMFPEGCLWRDGAVYVAACPKIWKFTDLNDDGIADQREVWFDGKTMTGCANDLHGPYTGPDGWIYWCKGAFAEQTYDLPGQPGWKTRASHVFRARPGPNGPKDIEPVFTAGMDNPVGLTWTPEGDLIVCGTFFQSPGGGRRDGLIHAVYGGVWGKDHDVLDGHPRTGPLMPPMTHLGPAAPCGMCRYGRDLLVCQFNMHKVSRHVLVPEGSTWRTEDSDFLWCDHPDFHPTDVLQAADGSVLVLDTGGWYKLCCPTSQLAKPEALGAIYRLKKKGGDVPRACPPPQWRTADPDDGQHPLAQLASPNPHLRRRAAEALGRAGKKDAVPALLAAAARADDRFLEHAITYAMIQLGDADATRPGLTHASPRVQKAALYALEQMPGAHIIDARAAIDRLAAGDEGIRDAALFVVKRHRDWAGELAPWIREQLARPDAGGAPLQQLLIAFSGDELTRELMGHELASAASPATRAALLDAMAQSAPKELPAVWAEPVRAVISSGDDGAVTGAMNVLRACQQVKIEDFSAVLDVLARDEARPPAVRLAASGLKPRSDLEAPQFEFIRARFRDDSATATATRLAAAAALVRAKLTTDQLISVAGLLPQAGPLELPALLRTFKGCNDAGVGLRLADAVTAKGVLKSLPADLISECLGAFPDEVQRLLVRARAGEYREAKVQQERLDELEKSLGGGDVPRGSLVFQGVKAACTTCHQIGYKGGQIGPDLSKIGAIRTPRDLLEAIVFPSASFVRSYEPVQITKNDGSLVYGIIRNQSADSLTLVCGPALPEAHVALADVKQMSPGTLSLMPAGMDQLLLPQELADLIAFLKSMK